MNYETNYFGAGITDMRTEINAEPICEVDLVDIAGRKKAIEAILNGNVVAGHMRKVYGLWFDANNLQTRESVSLLKEEPPGKKISIMMTGAKLLPYVDKFSIHASLRKYAEDSDIYSAVFGAVCHTVLPLDPSCAHIFPDTVKSHKDINGNSRDIVYNLDPTGHAGIEDFIKDLEYEGVIPAVTSMNQSSTPEITSYVKAASFLKERSHIYKVPVLFRDIKPCRSSVLGSFTQLDLVTGKIIRDGHIPANILAWMLDLEDEEVLKNSKYQQTEFEIQLPLLSERYNPQDIRQTILDYIHSVNATS